MRVAVAAGANVSALPTWLALLRAARPHDSFAPLPPHGPPPTDSSFDAAIVASPAAGALSSIRGLRLIQSCWAGVDGLLEDASLPVDVPLARLVDESMTARMVETALWAVLSLHRSFLAYTSASTARVWKPLPQVRAEDTPILILGGAGTLGSAVATALLRLNYPVCAWSSGSGSGGVKGSGSGGGGITHICGSAALLSTLPTSRIVINLLPLTPATRLLIDGAFIDALPRGVGVVNLGRGGHIDEDALLRALNSGHVGHAVLDVFNIEPLPPESALWAAHNVTILPHIAAITDPHSAVGVIVENLRRCEAGEPVLHLVDRARGY